MAYEKIFALVAAVTVVGSGVVLATPALAQNGKPVVVKGQPLDADVPTRRVSYRDLNLASYDGEKTLIRRVHGAVRDVCDDSAGYQPLATAMLTCRSQSWGRAKPQIDRAVRRAREIAANGHSSIAPVAIAVVAYK